ncbi:MAG: ZIP family metal transporter [Candidatus Poseidoniales archaeon]
MEGMTQALILAGVALFTALVAGGIPIMRGAGNDKSQKMMTGIAAGILLASALLVALPEGFTLTLSANPDIESLWMGVAILAGFILMLILEAYGFGHDIHEEHHDHEKDHGHGHVHHPNNARSIVLGLSIHALTDGLAIGAAVASGEVSIALAVAVGVIAHKIPAAFSIGIFSMHERNQAKDAWKDLILFAIAAPITIILAFLLLGGVDEQWIGLAILFSGGTFLYVATVDVLPDVHHTDTGKKALFHVLIGVVIMVVLLVGIDMSGMIEHAH